MREFKKYAFTITKFYKTFASLLPTSEFDHIAF